MHDDGDEEDLDEDEAVSTQYWSQYVASTQHARSTHAVSTQ